MEKSEYKQIGVTIFKSQSTKLKYLQYEGVNLSFEVRKLIDKLYEKKQEENKIIK
jgi:hypothetical protein